MAKTKDWWLSLEGWMAEFRGKGGHWLRRGMGLSAEGWVAEVRGMSD